MNDDVSGCERRRAVKKSLADLMVVAFKRISSMEQIIKSEQDRINDLQEAQVDLIARYNSAELRLEQLDKQRVLSDVPVSKKEVSNG